MNLLNQLDDHLWCAWAYVASGRTLAIVLGIAFAILAISLLIASRTRWGQTKPLTKCVVLSVLAHVWLLMYALGTRPVLPQGDLRGREQNLAISVERSASPAELNRMHAQVDQPSPSEPIRAATPVWEQPVPTEQLPQPSELLSGLQPSLTLPELLPPIEPASLPALPPPEELADLLEPQAASPQPMAETAVADSESPAPFDAGAADVLPSGIEHATQAESALPEAIEPPTAHVSQPVGSQSSPVLPPELQLPVTADLPREYVLRQAPNRLQLSAAFGSDADSEAAVEAGLSWLAAAQAASGAWIARDHGGGTETYALGEDRQGTGDRADTGVSGLALLAFLAAGHTHVDGPYQARVQQGLKFLLDVQMPSGDLSGPKQVGHARSVLNARMYCHSIATLALAEAYAMTHDAALKPALMRAAQYSINAQDPVGGGWRYQPREPGDLSQFGWQAMALHSLQRAGIAIPHDVDTRMRGFLDACSAGRAGGLATYRPGQGWPSDTMTAEALACRLLLDYPLEPSARREATDLLMRHRPGQTEDNVYYWYYATLALFQLQDENWRLWNQALKSRLLETQVPAYAPQAGSWNPDKVWGGYGGRVYATAMGCLCLEVYYRYLPMYQRANLARGPQELRSR